MNRLSCQLAPLVVAALLSCQSPGAGLDRHSAPLIGGTVTNDDHAVVALTRGGSSSFCTGTLISPRVVLTAAHCIDMLGNDPNASIYFGSDTAGEGLRIAVQAKKQHPMWTGEVGARDVGMMLMQFPYEDPRIAQQLSRDANDTQVGAAYRHVGFGVYDRDTQDADGKKRQGSTTVSGITGDIIQSGDANLSVCFGDSGGPAFVERDGVEVVAGIHSFTNGSNCNPPNGDTSVAIYADDFILPWVQENDKSCGLDGICGPIGCEDDPDCQPCGADGTCASDCELPDVDCPTQSIGDICRANSQCMSESCVALQGEREYKFCTQPCTGDGDCPSGMRCQNVNPFGDICYFDSDPPGLLGDSCEEGSQCGSYNCADGTCVVTCNLALNQGCPPEFACESRDNGENYFCYPEGGESGGCRSGGGSGGLAAFLLGLALWSRRRPRNGKMETE